MNRIIFAFLISLGSAFGQVVTSDPVGIVTYHPLPQSDTWFSLPFHRASVFEGSVTGIEGNVVTVSGDLAANLEAVPAYYLLVCTGELEGVTFPVVSHSGATITLTSNGVNLNAISTAAIRIIPYWTFGVLFPNGMGVDGTNSHSTRPTEILVYSGAEVGTNLSPSSTYYYFTGASKGWRKVGGGLATVRDGDIIPPGAVLIYRQNGTTSNQFASSGDVQLAGTAHLLPGRLPLAKQDHLLGPAVAGSLTLTEANLVEGGSFIGSSSHATRADELLIFDNAVPAKNRSPSSTYYYFTGTNPGWRKVGGGLNTVRNSDVVLHPGQAYIIRRAPAAASALYQAVPPYLE